MNLRAPLALLLLASLVPLARAESPNILFLAIDDLRPELGCYGAEGVDSPHIDRFAGSAVTFTRAYCQVAVCNPSRVSLLTGLRPDSARVWHLDERFRETVPGAVTLPQHFKQHGYQAVSFGKIFHNPWPDNVSWSEPHAWPARSRLWSQKERQALARAKKKLEDEGLPQPRIDRLRAAATEIVDYPEEEHIDGAIATQAIEAMQRLAAGDRPFFLAAGFVRPHLPFVVPRKYWDLYDRDAITLASDASLPGDAPPFAMNTMYELRDYHDFRVTPPPTGGSLSENQQRELKHGYLASVSFIDAQVGRILDELETLGLADTTIVVLWSDHGFKLGEHNSWCKQTNYEIDTRVPLLIRAPGIAGNGRKSEALVELLDLYPTLCDLAGLPTPESLEGTTLRPVLEDPSTSVKDIAVSQFARRTAGRERMGYAARTDRWRFVEWIDRGSGQTVARELYDHAVDPAESRNLGAMREYEALMTRLRQKLQATQEQPLGRTAAPVAKQLEAKAKARRPTLTFRNDTATTLTVYWQPEQGERREAAVLEPGESTTRKTTLGHRFIVEGRGIRREVTVTRNRETVRLAPPPESAGAGIDAPHIVVILGDDWSWPHASILGDATVSTPAFDRIAREGALFSHAFTQVPSCTPSRFSLASGQAPWRLGEGVNLGGSLADDVPVYPDLLAEAGYHTGFARKGASPSDHDYRGSDPFGRRYSDFAEFLAGREPGQPFCFLYGAGEPHRPYDTGASRSSQIDLDAIDVPPFLPDDETVRSDLGDYYLRIEQLDRFAGEILALLEEAGELENTIVVMTGDNGMPFPRAKATLYDAGTRVPLAIRWGKRIEKGRRIGGLTTLTDLAPTFLEAAGLPVPDLMTGASLLDALTGSTDGSPATGRDAVVTAMERHVFPYPTRAIRTRDHLYIRRFSPESWRTGLPASGRIPVFDFAETPWPTGAAAFSHNIDPGPSKQWMMQNDSPQDAQSFGPWPGEELYDLESDPHQVANLLAETGISDEVETTRSALSDRLTRMLADEGDARFTERPGHATFTMRGWTIHLSERLWSGEAPAIRRMLPLLDAQLQRVAESVPGPALVALRQTPIWINPPYEGKRGTAEYHPEGGWLSRNGRDPAMARAVEITNARHFPFENRRMPYLLLHELAHAYHHRVLPGRYGNGEIRAAWKRARDSGDYDEVPRFDGNRQVKDKAYAITNPMEYFAETSEALFGRNDFFPFDREELKAHDPMMHDLLLRLWGLGHPDDWTIDTAAEWQEARDTSEGLSLEGGIATPKDKAATYRSVARLFPEPKTLASFVLRPSPHWRNWTAIPSVGPAEATNAPVFLPVADGDYWFFAARKKSGRGYHAWRSADMKTWRHLGKVASSHWVTTAEYADGRIFLYYDEPNDQDPHLLVGENVEGELQWTDHGKVLADPSHGSDAGVIRTREGDFHLFYEDWTPLNAREHSWDSPLAGHASSPDGITGFRPHEFPFPIDDRTTPTERFGTYDHSSRDQPLVYRIHEGEQDAYGDYTAIQVGDRCYLFCDYDPHGEPMRVGCWWSDSVFTPFTWSGDIGMDFHPDPTVGFAEGQFYLIVQRADEDFVSPGPWVKRVVARAGADADGDGVAEQWTEWQEVGETYEGHDGFARVVDTIPASLDTTSLPPARGFRFELRLETADGSSFVPALDEVRMRFE